MDQWLEWERPWLLLLFLPLLLGWWWSRSHFFFKKSHAYLAHAPMNGNTRLHFMMRWFRFQYPHLLRLIVCCCLIAAMVDVTRGYGVVEEKHGTHRIFLILDSSSSMYGFQQVITPSITCTTTAKFFPRIHGACRALYKMVDEVERFAMTKENADDLIGLIQFAFHSYVVAYPTNDYEGLRKRINDLEHYLESILGKSTYMHLAIWDAYLMALERNMQKDSGFTYLSGEEVRNLAIALAPGDSALSPFVVSDGLRAKLEFIRIEMRDTVFIVITDAVVNYLTRFVEEGTPYSIRRQMQFGELLQTPFFYLSTDEFYPELKDLAQRTGWGEQDGPGRGDFLMVKSENDYAQMSALMSRILRERFSMKIQHSIVQRESYAEWFTGVALFFFLLSIWWKKSFGRSLTDIE